MAKRERDGWTVDTDEPDTFEASDEIGGYVGVYAIGSRVHVLAKDADLPPARAAQFAAKVAAIAARAAKEVKDGTQGT